MRPFIEICRDNFLLRYTPNEVISLDESCVPFKGRVKYLQYSKAKPNKFHIKMFIVSEHQSGYICTFSVYTGKGSNELLSKQSTLDLDCTITTKTIMSLLEKTKLLDKHRTVFFDNFFNSPEILDELRYRNSYGCGTVHGNHKGLPKAVVSKKIKLKKMKQFSEDKDISSA